MRLKNILIVSLVMTILTIGVVSASEDVMLTENVVNQYDTNDIISTQEDIISEDNLNQGSEVELNFKNLSDELHSDKTEITLQHDYKYDSTQDSEYKSISVSSYNSQIKSIDGDNHIIDGNGEAVDFYISKDNVVLKNIVFRNINSKSSNNFYVIHLYGKNTTLYNCTFENIALKSGGLISGIYENSAVDKCTFINNSASSLVSLYSEGCNITNCTFINNSASSLVSLSGDGSRITDCTFNNNSGEKYSTYYDNEVYIDNGKYDFDISVPKYCQIHPWGEWDPLASIVYHGSKSGNISILFDGIEVYNELCPPKQGNYVYLSSVNKIPVGIVNVTIIFRDDKSDIMLYNGTVNIDYYFEINPGRYEEDYEGYSNDILYYDYSVFHVSFPSDVSGNLSLSYDGYNNTNVKYETGSYYDSRYVFKISANGLKIGTHKIIASITNDLKYGNKTIEYAFYVTPKITVPDYVSAGEKEFITVEFPDDYKGIVTIYNGTYWEEIPQYYVGQGEIIEHYDKDQIIASANVIDGQVKIPVSKLVLGTNYIYVNCTGDGDYEMSYYIKYIQNDPKFTSSINTDVTEIGKEFILTLNTPKSNDELSIYVDGKLYKEITLDKTTFIEPISNLGVGQHHIKVVYYEAYYDQFDNYNEEYKYSNSFYVTVKEKSGQQSGDDSTKITPKPADKITLTLKKVKVKKSAKKVVLQATLKINGKAKKGLKVIFKFNGKKYTAKTNKNGIAKVTIKKSVLKKLKVGKKVKYQSSYGKITVKKTVKIKK